MKRGEDWKTGRLDPQSNVAGKCWKIPSSHGILWNFVAGKIIQKNRQLCAIVHCHCHV
jgi:hypothetical protein